MNPLLLVSFLSWSLKKKKSCPGERRRALFNSTFNLLQKNRPSSCSLSLQNYWKMNVAVDKLDDTQSTVNKIYFMVRLQWRQSVSLLSVLRSMRKSGFICVERRATGERWAEGAFYTSLETLGAQRRAAAGSVWWSICRASWVFPEDNTRPQSNTLVFLTVFAFTINVESMADSFWSTDLRSVSGWLFPVTETALINKTLPCSSNTAENEVSVS